MQINNQTEALLQNRIKELEESTRNRVDESLELVEINKKQIKSGELLYYNEKKDQKDQARYYHSISKIKDSHDLFFKYHALIRKTHKRQLPYFMSKDHYLYTWVDLQPDGSLKNIYSGINKDPKTLIEEDFSTIQKKHSEFQMLLRHNKDWHNKQFEKVPKIDLLKFNTEHIVPLSWYGAEDPMKGDLHHLFACQPECNIKRSNFPYADFSFYSPESPKEKIQNRCGVTMDGRFEPEYGKGAVARAMMYFLIRYPNKIHKTFRKKIDRSLLIRWHQQFGVTQYEKHRNQAIYSIQGNRNPFIDFPNLSDQFLPPNF